MSIVLWILFGLIVGAVVYYVLSASSTRDETMA